MSGRVKGFASWKPQKKTRALLVAIREVLGEYREYLPLTVRQVFYRLAGKGYPKTENFYDNVQEKCNRARRAGEIPWAAIRDDGVTRQGGEGFCYRSPEDYLAYQEELRNFYRRSWHADQPAHVSVLCEAAGMVPMLARVTADYRVPVESSSGFDSVTVKHDLYSGAKDRLEEHGQPTILLHLGDYDPSGDSIFTSMSEDLDAFARDEGLDDLIVMRRVALDGEQVRRYGLPTAPPKESDSRTPKWQDEGVSCQLEAAPPDTLTGLCRQAVEDALDLDALRESRERERREYREVQAKLDEVNVVLREAFRGQP